jgi:hypothetical protein
MIILFQALIPLSLLIVYQCDIYICELIILTVQFDLCMSSLHFEYKNWVCLIEVLKGSFHIPKDLHT